MIRASLTVLLCFGLFGCFCSDNTDSKDLDKIKILRWSDRHISITGLDPLTGQLISVPSYKLEEVYPILVTVDRFNIIPPGDSDLSGASRCEVTVLDAPAFCPFQKNDHIVIVGAPDGTTAWVRKGIVAEIIFFKKTNTFADFIMSSIEVRGQGPEGNQDKNSSKILP